MNYTIGLLASSTIKSGYNITKAIIDKKNDGSFELQKYIKDNDINIYVNTIKLMIKQIESNRKDTYNDAVEYSITAVNTALEDIDNELDAINERLKYNHEIRFITTFRTFHFHNNLIRLKSKISILDSRYKMLLTINK